MPHDTQPPAGLRPALVTRRRSHRSTQHPGAVTSTEWRTVINWRATSALVVSSAVSMAAGVLIATSVLSSVHVEAAAERDALTVLRSEQVSSALAAALATPCTSDEQHDCWWIRTGTDQMLVDVAGNVYPVTDEG